MRICNGRHSDGIDVINYRCIEHRATATFDKIQLNHRTELCSEYPKKTTSWQRSPYHIISVHKQPEGTQRLIDPPHRTCRLSFRFYTTLTDLMNVCASFTWPKNPPTPPANNRQLALPSASANGIISTSIRLSTPTRNTHTHNECVIASMATMWLLTVASVVFLQQGVAFNVHPLNATDRREEGHE